MKEKFVRINTIEGYEDIKDYYYISNSDEDKIMNKDTGKIMKSRPDKDGYKRVGLMTKDGKVKTCRIHVIKAKAFIHTVNPLNHKYLRHLNDVKTDNRLINLVWGTASENMKDRVRNRNFNYEASARGRSIGGKIGNTVIAKKYSKPVRCIETGIIYPSAKEAERRMGIHNANISHCCLGKRKTAGSFHWEFVDKK